MHFLHQTVTVASSSDMPMILATLNTSADIKGQVVSMLVHFLNFNKTLYAIPGFSLPSDFIEKFL
jgi:hypothetical protein